MATADEKQQTAVATALRLGVTSLICLIVTERLNLAMGYMSILSAHLIISVHDYTVFQKGVERIVGRVCGIVYGLFLVVFFRETPLLYLTLFLVAQLVFYYVYASGRLAYTAIQSGAFCVVVVATGMTSTPGAAVSIGGAILAQVFLGVGAAVLISWVTGAEGSLAIVTRGEPLLPLRADWLSRSIMMTTITLLSVAVALFFELPLIPTVISAAILSTAPAPAALRRKGVQRAAAPVIAGAFGLVAILVLSRVPRFGLLIALVCLAMFLSSYYTQVSARYSYAALQCGLALPMVLVSSPAELVDLGQAVKRLLGVLAGFAVALVVELLWPPLATTPPPPITDPQTPHQ